MISKWWCIIRIRRFKRNRDCLGFKDRKINNEFV